MNLKIWSQFNQSYKYLNAFIEDDTTKNFDAKKILNCMQYYNDNITKIKKEFNILENTKKWLNNHCLICIKQNYHINKIEDCFITAFENNNNNVENKNNNNINNVENIFEKSSFNLFPQEENENNYNNDKLLKQLDKLNIKLKIDNNNTAPRI